MYNKHIAGVLAVATLLPGLAFAETNTATQDQIFSLLTQIKALQQQLAAIVASSTTLNPNHEGPNPGGQKPKDDNKPLPPGPAGKNSCVTLTRNLKIGLQGDDVKKLQELLGEDPANDFRGAATGFFGPLTATAMIKFQIRQGIASSSDGTVGPKTRAFFADKCGKGPGPKDDKAPKEQHSAANGTVTLNTGSSITVQTNDGRSVVVNITASNADGSINAKHIKVGLVPPGKPGDGRDGPSAEKSISVTVAPPSEPTPTPSATNIVRNPNFATWSSIPASGAVVAANGGGFGYGLPDYWYGGAGPGATVQFNRSPLSSTQTDIPGNPPYYGNYTWTVAPTSGSTDEYTGANRATYLEHGQEYLEPQDMAGKIWSFSFWGRVSNGTLPVAPIMWISTGVGPWVSGQSYTAGEYIQVWPRGYRAVTSGTAGPNAPTWTSGAQSDGGVSWEYLGHFKGRGYDLYEGGPNVMQGVAYATTDGGAPHQGATCTLTTSWTKCDIAIKIPALGYTNTTDYVTSGDPVRTLMPLSTRAGTNPYIGVGLDIIPLPELGPNGIFQLNMTSFDIHEIAVVE